MNHIPEIWRRNKNIYKQRLSGMTFKIIGDLHGISGARAAQVFHIMEHYVAKGRYKP